MSIYLGNTLLTGSGGGGGAVDGGGALPSDPREMNRSFVYMPRCEVKNAESTHTFLHQEYVDVFDDSKGGIFATLSTVDTYVTTHDITASTKGGGVLHLLMLGSLYAGVVGDTTTCRITLDGEEYVIDTSLGTNDSQGYYKPLMGNFTLGGQAVTATTSNTIWDYNFGNNYRTMWQGSFPYFTNGFTSGSPNQSGYTYVPTVTSIGQLGGVRFKESLKIEFKADKVGAGSYIANKVGSIVTQF